MSDILMSTIVLLLAAAIGAVLCEPLARAMRRPADRPVEPRARGDVGIGTVRSIADPITVDVESISGQRFVGRLRPHPNGPALAAMRPGVVLLVMFDPAAREQLSLADDIVAVRTAFDQMLVRKGLVSGAQMALIRHGTRARAVVTAMTATGATREDYREVELDLMVRKPTGGQFPAHETALIPGSALTAVAPGCVIDAYYTHGDESSVAVCVPAG
jgi:hypothetical protein